MRVETGAEGTGRRPLPVAAQVLVLVGLAWAVTGVAAVGLLTACALACRPWVRRRLVQRRAARLDEVALVEVLDLVSRGVRSGLAVHAALDDACSVVGGPLATRLQVCADGPLAEGLDTWARREATDSARLVAAVGRAAWAGGGDPARGFDAAARALRARHAARREVAAAAAQAKASALLLACAPIGVLAVSAAADPGLFGSTVRDPVAAACVALGVVCDTVGLLWMRHLTAQLGGGR